MWRGPGAAFMPDESTQGGFTVIFQNMLQHQVTLATMKTTLDRTAPPLTLKARDQLQGRKTHNRPDLKMVEKTYRAVEQLSHRNSNDKNSFHGPPSTAHLSAIFSKNRKVKPSFEVLEHQRRLDKMQKAMKIDSESRPLLNRSPPPRSPSSASHVGNMSARSSGPMSARPQSAMPHPPSSARPMTGRPATARPSTARPTSHSSHGHVTAAEAARNTLRDLGVDGAKRAATLGRPSSAMNRSTQSALSGGLSDPAAYAKLLESARAQHAESSARRPLSASAVPRSARAREADAPLNSMAFTGKLKRPTSAQFSPSYKATQVAQNQTTSPKPVAQTVAAAKVMSPVAKVTSPSAPKVASPTVGGGGGAAAALNQSAPPTPELMAAIRALSTSIDLLISAPVANPYIELKKRLVDVIVDHRVYKSTHISLLFQVCRRYAELDPAVVSQVVAELEEELAIVSGSK